MVKKIKFLPAIAVLALSIVAFFGTNQANAYVTINGQDVDGVKICHEIIGAVGQIPSGALTYTYSLLVPSASAQHIDLNNVSLVSGGTITGQTSYAMTIEMPFTYSGTGSAEACVTLNMNNVVSCATDANSVCWNDKEINVTESSSNPTKYPAAEGTQQISFKYELDTDSNGSPIYNSNANDWQAALTLKDQPTFQTEMIIPKTHITLQKQVRGNFANTAKKFTFTINVEKLDNTVGGSTFHVEYGNSSRDCNYNDTSCTITLAHGETAKIGYDSSLTEPNQFYVGLFRYTITEATASEYNTSYDTVTNGTPSGSPVTSNVYPNSGKRVLDEDDSIIFYNERSSALSGRFLVIFPFVVLAAAATITIIAVRKTSKSKEQA